MNANQAISLTNVARPADTAKAQDVLRDARVILLDWDGCVAIQNRPHPIALRFIARYQERVTIVSNNSTNLPEDFSNTLAQFGVEVAPERIFLAGTEAIALAAQAAPARTMVLGDRRMTEHAREQGISLDHADPELVVLLRDTDFSYPKLERAANALALGAKLIIANPDMTHPGPQGVVVPETGALLAALSACIDPAAIPLQIVGKPEPLLFMKACAALGTTPDQAVMIGDNPATDLKGAHALGMTTLLVDPKSDASLRDFIAPI